MVRIKYFKDVTKSEFINEEFDTVGDFLRYTNLNKSRLIKLRFFEGNILGSEIDTSTGEFIDVSEGEITVIDGDTVPMGGAASAITGAIGITAAVLFPAFAIPILVGTAVAVAALSVGVPDVNIPNTGSSRSQGSTTNSLGQTNNELVSPGVRIDDIFGTVANHTPKMWQTPYRIGVNNQETEIMLLCIGRGKYEIDNNKILDSTTKYLNLPNSAANLYAPGTWPGNGTPYQTIGEVIDRPIGIYRESASLNSTELLPPNDLTLGSSASWTISGDGSTGTFTLTNAGTLEVSLLDYFAVGQNLSVLDAVVATQDTVNVYRLSDDPEEPVYKDFAVRFLLTGDYEITSLTDSVITVTGFNFDFNTTTMLTSAYTVRQVSGDVRAFLTSDSTINSYTWYLTSNDEELDVDSDTLHSGDIGQTFNNIIGPFILDEGTTSAIVNLTSFSGFYKVDGSTYKDVSASVRIVVEELDEDDEPTGNQVTSTVSYSTHPTSRTSSVYQTYEIDVPYVYSRIYASRTTDRDKSSGVSNVDKIEWTLLYTFQPNPDDMDLGDVTLMHCLVSSNSQSRLVKSRKTNLTVTRKVTQYLGNGVFGETEAYPTNRFDQILIHTALDPYCGRLTEEDINADNLLDLYDEIVEYSGDATMTAFGYDFDTSQISYDDMFKTVCDVVNCIPYMRDGKYDAFFEKEQSSSTIQVTHRNKIPGSETVSEDFSLTYDGVELTYRDNEDGISKVIYLPEDRSATSPETKELPGCTNTIQATQYAYRMYNKQRYQRKVVTFDVDEFGRMITPGQRMDSPDGTRFNKWAVTEDGYRVYDGEVVEVNGLEIELSQPVVFTEGENHYIQFTNVDGDNSELIQCTEGDDPYLVVLSSLPVENIYDGYDQDRTKFTFCSEQLRESIALIPQSVEVSIDDDGNETNTITSKNYDPRIYQNDIRA